MHSTLCDTLTRKFQWKNNQRKRNSESDISQNVSGMFLSIWVSVTAVLEASFPQFNITCKENSIHYSLLIDVFGKAEMHAGEKVTVQVG